MRPRCWLGCDLSPALRCTEALPHRVNALAAARRAQKAKRAPVKEPPKASVPKRVARKKPAPEKREPAPRKEAKGPFDVLPGISPMQQAIVWREILGTPAGLRQNVFGREA